MHDEPAEWHEHRPQTEEEAEALQSESDRLNDRIQARLAREGPEADLERILDEEIERRRLERGEPPLTAEEEAERDNWIDEVNRIANEALAHPDPELEAELTLRHPLAERAFALTLQLFEAWKDRDDVARATSTEHPIAEILRSLSCASAKLAGALHGRHWPPPVDDCAGVIVRLKRARGYFDDVLLALEVCGEQALIEPGPLAASQRDVDGFARETDRLIQELRERLARGFE
jgi:hypothetical protein